MARLKKIGNNPATNNDCMYTAVVRAIEMLQNNRDGKREDSTGDFLIDLVLLLKLRFMMDLVMDKHMSEQLVKSLEFVSPDNTSAKGTELHTAASLGRVEYRRTLFKHIMDKEIASDMEVMLMNSYIENNADLKEKIYISSVHIIENQINKNQKQLEEGVYYVLNEGRHFEIYEKDDDAPGES